jgi:membrane-associated phospholipid phosphatase
MTSVQAWPAAPFSAAGALSREARLDSTRVDTAGSSRNGSKWVRTAVSALGHALPFGLVALGYEAIRLVPRNTAVHIADLVELEARLFSVGTEAGPRALSDVIARHTHPLLDLWCGATYLAWVPGVVAAIAYLFVRARPKALELSVAFLVANLAGWAIWFLYPAAPPWYVDQYGTGPAVMNAASSAAGLSRLDTLVGLPIASSVYSQSAYIFGAMPSLHVAYATLVAWVSFPLGGKLRLASLVFATSMAFSAIYLRHHYILDVIAGVALAVPVALLVQLTLRRLASLPPASV